MQTKKKSSNKQVLFGAALLLILAAIAAGTWYYLRDSSPKSQTTTQQSPTDNTDQESGESEPVTVPDDVDPSSIKPYTLITENETFKIRELDGAYVITLYAIINRPEQSEQYYDQLRQYKQDALNYLRKQSVDVNNVSIRYEPEEATNL